MKFDNSFAQVADLRKWVVSQPDKILLQEYDDETKLLGEGFNNAFKNNKIYYACDAYVSIELIIPSQPYIYREGLLKKIDDNEWVTNPPHICIVNGKHLIKDGTHRIAVNSLLGRQQLFCSVFQIKSNEWF